MVEHLGHNYNCIDTFSDKLANLVQFSPYSMGNDKLKATDIAQLFFAQNVELFGVLKSIV